MKDWASVPLRLGLGVVFLGHGLQKAFGLFGGPGIPGFAKMLAGMGFAPASFWAYVAAYVELLGGLFLILGIGVRVSSALIFVLMVVATVKVHLAKGLFLSSGGFEYNLVILCVCLALLLSGPDKLCITKKL
ncbi:MAG: DoxX family protein [Candidatus Omnitrophota bacterium]